jgi:hypothetical protein
MRQRLQRVRTYCPIRPAPGLRDPFPVENGRFRRPLRLGEALPVSKQAIGHIFAHRGSAKEPIYLKRKGRFCGNGPGCFGLARRFRYDLQ